MNTDNNKKYTEDDLIKYVYDQIALEIGREKLRHTHYLEKEYMFDSYYGNHEEELKEKFEGVGWPMFL